MQIYDPQKPLIFCHIPKTAGISVRAVFETWFGANLLPHYAAGGLPPQYDLTQPPIAGAPVAVYGHFNSARGFGVQDYYPQVDQFVTILRDPWDRALSIYFYVRSIGPEHPLFARTEDGDLEKYLEKQMVTWRDHGCPSMKQLPRSFTLETYQDVLNKYFVAIGVTDALSASLAHISEVLGTTFEADQLSHLNVTPRQDEIPLHLKPAFIESCPLEYTLYRYVRDQF